MPFGSPLLSSGAGVAARGALGEHVDRRVEPDGDRALVEQFAGARIDEGAAAGRDHPHLGRRPAAPPVAARRRGNRARRSVRTAPPAGSPTASSISESLSTNGSPSRLASRRPTVDFPTPISPTSTTGRSRRLPNSVTRGAIQRLAALGKSAAHAQHCSPDRRPRAHPRRALCFLSTVPKEQPTKTIEVDCARTGGNAH